MVMEEVLFEYKDSKREIHLDRATVCADVERELNRFGFKNVYVCLCGIEGATFEGKEIFLLQRWSRKWNTFVDVNCTEELNAGDKITVIRKPVNSPTKVKDGYEGAQSILKRVSKPTDVEVKELAKFFPSYRQKQKAGPSGFNPNADCVIAENKKKKKAAVKRKPKDSNVTVVLMGKYSPSVPKGKVRQKLATDGRMQSIRVSREMSSQEIRFGCTEIPTPKNIHRLVTSVARHQFLGKPLGMLYTLHAGVPKPHQIFWNQFSVQKLYSLYKAMNATTSTVLKLLDEPEFYNHAEERVYGYLTTFIGNCKEDELRTFLSFVTGSSVVVDKSIEITFNNLSGLARRPISHTCNCCLELPTSYGTFLEFENELQMILKDEASFAMDAI